MFKPLVSLALALGIASVSAMAAHSTASAVATAPPAPCAAVIPPGVTVQGGAYSPTPLALARPGSTVTWTFHSPAASVTSTNIALLNSGVKSSGTYKFNFWSAGTYPYHSTTNASQTGQITVKMCNVPATARVGSTVYMQPASSHHTGWVADIQIRRPGTSTWTWLKQGLTTTMTSFVPTKTGTYGVRARLRHTTNNQVSGLSPISVLKVS
jgi:plastocyanin